MKPLLLRHLDGENIGRFPVWMMRQAGRYLPRYRQIRERYSFWEMATSPELIAEVSLLPLEVVPVDGIIFFADILTVPKALGLSIEMQEKLGPVLKEPLRAVTDFDRFLSYEPSHHTFFIAQALHSIHAKLPQDLALLGFAGAPWTVACYLVEGRPGKDFAAIRNWLERDPLSLTQALERLAEATIRYLKSQLASGAHLLQLFDTWLGHMPPSFFQAHYLPLLQRIFNEVARDRMIYFTKQATAFAKGLSQLHCRVMSVDNSWSLSQWDQALAGKFSLQGNLDPQLLLADEATVRLKTRLLVQQARGLKRPAVLNLGHGILPGTPVENAKAFVEEARASWL